MIHLMVMIRRQLNEKDPPRNLLVCQSAVASPPSSPMKRRKYGQKNYGEVNSGSSEFVPGHEFIQSEEVSDAGSISGCSLNEAHELSLQSCSSDKSSDASSECSDNSVEDLDNSDLSDTSSAGQSSCSNSDGSSNSSVQENDWKQMLFNTSEKSTDEAILALMELYVQRRWDKTTLQDFVAFCREYFPSNLPKTVHKLFKYVEGPLSKDYNETVHFYCSDCRSPKAQSDDVCMSCQSTDYGVFFELPLSIQIKHFFEHRKLASPIDSHNINRDDTDIVSDIYSGINYREIREKVNGEYDLILGFNLDGVSPVQSSQSHLYPTLATICEVPLKLRSSFMLVCGIWYDHKHPPILDNFFGPFVTSLKKLSEEGVSWTHPVSHEIKTSFVNAPLLVADAPMKADTLGMQRFNSKYGCTSCEQKTKRINVVQDDTQVKKKRKVRRFVYRENPARLRDKLRIDNHGLRACNEGHSVKGVKGPAIVSQIPYFDRSKSAVPDYMHCVLLGVVRLLMTLWFFTPGEWCIKDTMKDIDQFILKCVKVTDQFSRIPRQLKDLKFWKANELRTWLLFISLPTLHEKLPENFFQHYMLLVPAILILLKEKITQNEINMAETMLRVFVRDFSSLYGPQYYVYNVHTLLHLCQYVRMWGPLWATSAFQYEHFNHILGDLAHGTKHKGKEIVNRIRIAHGVQILRSKVCSNDACKSTDCFLGLPIAMSTLITKNNLPNDAYLRATYKGEILTSITHDRKTKRSNSLVQFTTAEGLTQYGQIVCFYLNNEEMYTLIKAFKVVHTDIFYHCESRARVTHLVPFSETDNVVSAPVSSVVNKLANVGSYLCIRPNSFEKNL